jgi:hypothetical protein
MEGQTERFGGGFLTQTADPRVAAWRTSDHNSMISGDLPVKSNGFVVFKVVATGTIVSLQLICGIIPTKTRKPLGVLPSHYVTRLVTARAVFSPGVRHLRLPSRVDTISEFIRTENWLGEVHYASI